MPLCVSRWEVEGVGGGEIMGTDLMFWILNSDISLAKAKPKTSIYKKLSVKPPVMPPVSL